MIFKNLSRVLPFFLGTLALLSTRAQAQVMSLDEAIKKGLENNRSLKISSYKIQLAEVKYQEAVDLTLPSLKASAGYTRLSDVEEPKIQIPGAPEPVSLFPVYVNNYNAKVSLSETIFSGFRLKYAMQSKQLLRDAAKLDAEKERDEVKLTIINAYINLYKLQQSLRIVEENLNLLDQRIGEAQKMEQQGVMLHNDELRLELQKSNIEMTRVDLENNLAVAQYNFNILIGNDEKSKVMADSNAVLSPPSLQPLETYQADAMKNRSDLKALSTRNKSFENNLRIARNSYYPQLAVAANYYDARPNPRIIPPQDKFVSTWDAGVVLTWDLMNLYSNKHNVSDSRIQLLQSEESFHQLEDAVKMDVNQQYLACMNAVRKIDLLQVSVTQAEENYRIVNSRFRNSLALTSDVVDADASLLQARINLALAQADATLNYFRLLKATAAIN